MPMKKEVCRNFQRGSCQYGQRCKFLHVTSQQQKPPNNIFSYQQQQQQKPNPYGFGVQNNPQPKGAPDFGSKSNQFKQPFENSWTRSSAHTARSTSEKQSQATNHKCTDPESCRRLIVEDFEQERPLWRLTCYGHWKNAPCDIVGDISYEELRAAAYDDANCGLSLPSIVDRERNLVNSKVLEFENLCKSGSTTRITPANQNTFPVTGPNAFSQNAQGAPASVSSFSQLGTSLNMGFGPRPPAPLNNPVVQPNPFGVSGETSSAFGIKDLSSRSQGSTFTPTPFFSNNSFMRAESNPVTTSTVSNQFLGATNSHSPVPFVGLSFSSNSNGPATTELQQGEESSRVDPSVWSRNKWSPGEIPEEAPPDAFCY